MRRRLVAGNWKMNGTGANLPELTKLAQDHPDRSCEILICPPAPLIHRAAQVAQGSALNIGAQDCHAKTHGAHAGDNSVGMLADAGARFVIAGHSSRRAPYREKNADVLAKTRAVMEGSLSAIVCVGENLAERQADQALDVVARQLSGTIPDTATAQNLVVAYEAVWAIGTGVSATLAQIGEMHNFIRTRLEQRFGPETGKAIRLLYGGSVKPTNAAEIFAVPNVDGALVGRASLRAADFSPIITALDAA